MNEGFHLINSGDILLIMNQNLITWLGQGYFATLFAVGMAIWCIRYLLQLTLAPLDKQNQSNKPLMYIICGIILWALLVVPLNRFPYLNTLVDAVPGQYVTPASAFGKRTLADGTDYLTLVLSRVFPAGKALQARALLEPPARHRQGPLVQNLAKKEPVNRSWPGLPGLRNSKSSK